jgi:hypothetical protein
VAERDLSVDRGAERAPPPPPLDETADFDGREGADDAERPAGSMTRRLFRVFGALFEVHLVTARAEVRRDQARVLLGVIMLLVGATLLGAAALLLQVVGVWALLQRGHSLALSALIVGSVDLALAATFLLLGARALRRPILASTRALLKRTISNLTA